MSANQPKLKSDNELQDIFRLHFEAQFKPIANKRARKTDEKPLEHSSITNEESEWEGISESEGEDMIEVIDYGPQKDPDSLLSKKDFKAFMTSKPPSLSANPSKALNSKKTAPLDSADGMEAANLKNDIELQRLLSESHLLDSASPTSISRVNRHKAIDLRVQSLGSKVSILTQEKMPMSHRKGIVGKAKTKEAKRRSEARENGIILEKVKKPKRRSEGKRERGMGRPAIGSFKGGTLQLSKRDVFRVQGHK
ncbi:MAG: hypothetical protein M1829_000541 [Trizodia sp. TS-e1964]|nr:MAG: hypothetical protein M1829_000541 [Trizodia sp. TS-e1964]